jgi:hypothetical protein
MKRLALAVSFLALAATASAGIVDDVLKAYGGADAWKNVKSFRESGSVASPTRPAPGDYVRLWTRPDKLTVEITFPSSKEVRVVDGEHGTQNGKEATGAGLDGMRLQAARLALPSILLDRRADVRDLGMREGRHVVEVAIAPGMTVTAELDPATSRILRSTSKSKDLEFATNYSDFRSVDGLLFPFAEENFANGTKTANITLTKIEINPKP